MLSIISGRLVMNYMCANGILDSEIQAEQPSIPGMFNLQHCKILKLPNGIDIAAFEDYYSKSFVKYIQFGSPF